MLQERRGEGSEPKAELGKRSHLRTVRPAAFPPYLCCGHVGWLHHPCLACGCGATERKGSVTRVSSDSLHLWGVSRAPVLWWGRAKRSGVPRKLVGKVPLLETSARWKGRWERKGLSPGLGGCKWDLSGAPPNGYKHREERGRHPPITQANGTHWPERGTCGNWPAGRTERELGSRKG